MVVLVAELLSNGIYILLHYYIFYHHEYHFNEFIQDPTTRRKVARAGRRSEAEGAEEIGTRRISQAKGCQRGSYHIEGTEEYSSTPAALMHSLTCI